MWTLVTCSDQGPDPCQSPEVSLIITPFLAVTSDISLTVRELSCPCFKVLFATKLYPFDAGIPHAQFLYFLSEDVYTCMGVCLAQCL